MLATPSSWEKAVLSSRRSRACASGPASIWSSPSKAAPTIAAEAVGRTVTLGATSCNAESIAASRAPCGVLQDSSAKENLHRFVEQIQAGQRDPGERHHLRGKTLDDLRRDGVVRGFGEHDGRELDDAAPCYSAAVNCFGQLTRRRQPEVGRHRTLQACAGAAAVFAACAGRHGGKAEVVPPAPVAGDRTERGKACDGRPATHRRS